MDFFSLLKPLRRLLYLVVLCFFAFFEISRSGMVRQTFEFYTFDKGEVVIETRKLPKAASSEEEITSYVEEALLGPVSLNLAPLLARETKLRSLLYRDGTVFADFSSQAAMPVPEAKTGVFEGLMTLNRGIRRNFPYVNEVVLFIMGNEAFSKEFADKFRK